MPEPGRRLSGRAGLWWLASMAARVFPLQLTRPVAAGLVSLAFRLLPARHRTVVANLLPACNGDRANAEKVAHRVYRRFSAKLIDLWRLESGLVVNNWLTRPGELDIIQDALARGKGVLFVTLHLGNWEHGGALLSSIGIRLTVATLPEPDNRSTQLRVDARARLGIDTLILGQDSFALVEAIKLLQSGASVAIAIDRPAAGTSSEIELFGRRFAASLAAAELARASGCALIGVTIVRRPEGFQVNVLPEFCYDRRELGSVSGRRAFTQHIMSVFEQEILKDLDQWYQFTPVWPTERAKPNSEES